MNLQPHEQRVVSELTEVRERFIKLLDFVQSDNPTFQTLDQLNQSLLRQQLLFMNGYIAVLEERINLFKS